MKKRGYCYPYPRREGLVQIVESGPLGTATCLHNRPRYTLDEARQVCRWLNGNDRPLEILKDREADPWDPLYSTETLHRMAGGAVNYPRKGLALEHDKE